VLIDILILRMLHAFRILKLTAYVREFSSLGQAFYASRRKVAVFLAVVALLVVVLGTLMYVVEGPENGFTSIPVAIYWAITTMTKVGFGDIAPRTSLGRVVASVVMLLGWGILAVPTGIVTAEMTTRRLSEADDRPRRHCPSCGSVIHAAEARFCHRCGAPLV
jgi:voltage-gated potassium channel